MTRSVGPRCVLMALVVLATVLRRDTDVAWAQKPAPGGPATPAPEEPPGVGGDRERWQRMSAEERQRLRERWQQLSPEERQRLRESQRSARPEAQPGSRPPGPPASSTEAPPGRPR